MSRILVLDEHSVYRTGLCHFLRSELPRDEVFDASNLNEALPEIRNRIFDLVLVGFDQSGLGARFLKYRTRSLAIDPFHHRIRI